MTMLRLTELLCQLDLRPSEEDVLDVLWLAAQLKAGSPPPRSGREAPHQAIPQMEGAPVPGHSPGLPSRQADAWAGETAYSFHVRPAASGVAAAGESAVAARVPAASALGGQLNLTRALRPLRRKVASRHHELLDEEATASRVAEERLWIPAMTPAPTRWLELALVVDGHESMSIWRKAVAELRGLLERLGTFRDVRYWVLDHPERDLMRPRVRRRRDSSLRSPRELIDPAGNRAILVVSDCLGPMWQSHAAQQVLAEWARHGPVAIVQPLPQRLWQYSHAQPVRARLHAFQPGVPNSRLVCRTKAGPVGSRPTTAVPVPILELDASWLASWSRLVAATGTTAVDSMVMLAGGQSGPTPGDPESGNETRTATQRVRDFRATASPSAVRLAEFMTAAPISLPVIRLVQEVMMHSSSQSQLAELLLGGLLYRLEGQEGVDPDEVVYDFLPGVREILIRRLRRDEALRTLQEVSKHVGARLGQARDFRALLAGLDLGGEFLVDPDSRPFARVAAQVLGFLGGQYAEPARRLAAALPDTRESSPPSAGRVAEFPVVIQAPARPEDGPSQLPERETPGSGTEMRSPGTAIPHHPEAETPAADTSAAEPLDAEEERQFARTLAQLSFEDRRSKHRPLVCPYCYHAFAEGAIAFRCSGRSSAARAGCSPEPDEALPWVHGKPAEVPPVFTPRAHRDVAECPRCHWPTRSQVCPECHRLLPAGFRAVQGRLIALVGPSQAGKTAFMTVLIHELRNQAGERLNASVMGADATTQEDFTKYYEVPMYEDSVLQLTPPRQDQIPPLVFRFTLNQPRLFRPHSYELLLSFADSAGEDLVSSDKIELMARYLTAADAVMILLDPLQFEAVRRQVSPGTPIPKLPTRTSQPVAVFDRITRLLQAGAGSQMIEKPVAIVLSKIDALWPLLPEDHLLRTPRPVLPLFGSADSLALQQQVRALLQDWGASSIDERAREIYKVSRYFAVSALGAPPTPGNLVSEQGINPHRVGDPFIWLLNQFGFIKSG